MRVVDCRLVTCLVTTVVLIGGMAHLEPKWDRLARNGTNLVRLYECTHSAEFVVEDDHTGTAVSHVIHRTHRAGLGPWSTVERNSGKVK